MPPEVLNASWDVVQADAMAPPVRDAVGAPLPPDAPLPSEPWEVELCELCELAELGEEESPASDGLVSPPWQAVSDRPATAVTASSESFWTRMVPLRRCGFGGAGDVLTHETATAVGAFRSTPLSYAAVTNG
jgi:hypothetical protein